MIKKFEIVRDGRIVYSVPCLSISFKIKGLEKTFTIDEIEKFNGSIVSNNNSIQFVLDLKDEDVI